MLTLYRVSPIILMHTSGSAVGRPLAVATVREHSARMAMAAHTNWTRYRSVRERS